MKTVEVFYNPITCDWDERIEAARKIHGESTSIIAVPSNSGLLSNTGQDYNRSWERRFSEKHKQKKQSEQKTIKLEKLEIKLIRSIIQMTKNLTSLTPECTIVWPDLFEPTSFNGGEPQYRALLLIEKDSDLTDLERAIHEAALRKFPGQDADFYKRLRQPIRDGAEKAVDEHGRVDTTSFYHNRYFMNVKSKFQPEVVDIYNEPITEPEKLYSGCKVRAYLSFYGYDYLGNRGVSCNLLALVKIADGDPITGGKVDTGTVFAGIVKPQETVFETGALESDISF